MSGGHPRNAFLWRVERRLEEVRHRLIVEKTCGETSAPGGAANVPGFLEMEEELHEEAVELEWVLQEQALLEQALQRNSTY